jgi:signal transduction histidine kinase
VIGSRIFRRTYLLTIFTIIVFILLGSLTSRIISRFAGEPKRPGGPIFFAHIIDGLDAGDRIKSLAKIESWKDENFPMTFELIDAKGKVLYPPGAPLPMDWSKAKKPESAYQSESEMELEGHLPGHWDLVRLAGDPAQYLLVTFQPKHGPGSRPAHGGPFFFVFGSLGISILLGVGVSLFFFFRSLQDKAKMADSVIAELQRGNLKARFPIGKMDEIGQAMHRFNLMADEIERLVEHLRSIEGARVSLLQELAHDLRTPIASLRSLLETIQSSDEALDRKTRQEVLSLALKETHYFERLVEDLLVLAQVSEPRYHGENHTIDLNELLEEEGESVNAKFSNDPKNVVLKKNIPAQTIRVQGDIHLLRRMIRNALDNAFSFAQSEVEISLLQMDKGVARIIVSDDGKGFSDEAFRSFGERRVSRVLGGTREGRVSVGLGSVIIKTVARIHRGSVSVKNRLVAGKISGAEVTIDLPLVS